LGLVAGLACSQEHSTVERVGVEADSGATPLADGPDSAQDGEAEASDAGADASPNPTTPGPVPLTMLGSTQYKGLAGGLYPAGSNDVPAAHLTAGILRAQALTPLATDGAASASGKMVLLSIGMSNTTQEFCAASSTAPCTSWSFAWQAAADSAVDHSRLMIVNGAQASSVASFWDEVSDPDYSRVKGKLEAQGLSERQVVAAWVKVANPAPHTSLPDPNADAYALMATLGNIVRAMHVHYPNLRLVFLSSRIYAGYATSPLNPEPFAYESGFAVKWAIEAQIRQRETGAIDPRVGDLLPDPAAPWVGWGPYLWANGTSPREDGLTWAPSDFEPADGTHPARSAEEKVGRMLLSFFKTSPVTRCWFLQSGSCN